MMGFHYTLWYIFAFLGGLCWGSFLNVVAYRIAYDRPFFTARSYCPHCLTVIRWYDNIPVLSWILLLGKCRACRHPISFVYPAFELITGIVALLVAAKMLPRFFPLYYVTTNTPFCLDVGQFYESVCGSLLGYALGSTISSWIFLSALIVGTITDIRAMIIPQLFSVWLAPIGILLSFFGLTDISYSMSIVGAILGYGVLWGVAALFKYLTNKEGLGIGDMEFLCMIGAFLGPLGIWFSLMIGSLVGMIIGSLYIIIKRRSSMTRIPFGPFLALGAIIYFFFEPFLITFLAY